jgi:nucleoside-diphosphate-sugar epimerase
VLLENGHSVVGIDNLSYGNLANIPKGDKFKFQELDIRDSSILDSFTNVDTVFHFAAISSLPECQANPGEAYAVNVAGTANVLECARVNGVNKVVFASTSAVYENNLDTPFYESDQVCPDLVYSHTKQVSENIALNYFNNYGLTTKVIRFFNVYGPHQNYLRKSPPLIGYIIRSVINDQTPIFHSDGNQERDYIYIDDLIDLLLLVSETQKKDFEIYNACSGELASVKDIYREVQKIYTTSKQATYSESVKFWNNYPVLNSGRYPLNLDRISKEVNKLSLGSFGKAEKEFDWLPKTSLEEGISKVMSFVLRNSILIKDTE